MSIATISQSVEYEFRIKYGCYPFEYVSRLLKRGLIREQAFAKLQENIDKVWYEMKQNYERNVARNYLESPNDDSDPYSF